MMRSKGCGAGGSRVPVTIVFKSEQTTNPQRPLGYIIVADFPDGTGHKCGRSIRRNNDNTGVLLWSVLCRPCAILAGWIW